MVLETIISPKTARKHSWQIAILAFIFTSIGIFAANYLGIYQSIVAITLVSMPAVPFVWRLFDFEEEETEKGVVMGSRTIARHLPVIMVLSMLFIGLIAGFVFWYFALPAEASKTIFEVQNTELANIGVNTGKTIFAIAQDKFLDTFEMLFFHNFGVLLIILLFSILYSSGAVFVLVWNASIIGAFIGNYAKAVSQGSNVVALLGGIGTSALGLFPHGSFELLAYLTAALAGGILSSAITREVHKSNAFILVLHDSIKLTAISIILLAIGAFIEAGTIVG